MSERARDLRLDFFRGLGLLFIFIDHIPYNVVAYLTLQNFEFSDAAEIFVFISGYTAAMVFGKTLMRQGPALAMVGILKRCWTLYVAHIFLFVIFVAEVSYTATEFNNPMFIDEMNITNFLAEPHIAVIKALTLEFHPVFMDILPLYIVLLLTLAFTLPAVRAWPLPSLLVSAIVYLLANFFRINLPTFPDGQWYFNPLCWQFLFMIGAVFGVSNLPGARPVPLPRVLLYVTVPILAVATMAKLALNVADLLEATPPAVVEALWVVGEKGWLGPLRLANFLALAHVISVAVKRDSRIFEHPLASPVILCGQNSLNIFCLGIFLSFLGYFAQVEFDATPLNQFIISVTGILIMFAAARFLKWSKGEGRPKVSPAVPGRTSVVP